MALAIAVGIVAPAGATTLVRAGMEKLVAENSTIVVGDVVDANSYWNADGSFILTDVRLAVSQVLKGRPQDREIKITLMGGRVGDLTTLIIGGPELVPGRSYVLFLNNEDLPGVQGVTTVRDLVQGAFDLVLAKDGVRAVSQANSHPLLPDAKGYVDAPGGVEGMPLNAMIESIREQVERPRTDRPEVN
ncbi:MAG TPA: hypothetical protein VHC97_23335 [Thermoanaerobaculia bacterium]|nr:hypothetical protein [Thermoanaerobaculia bacterium]